MAETLRLLHTAKAHIARFNALGARLCPERVLEHVVRPDLLSRAQSGGLTDDLARDVAQAVGTGPTLCTCSSIGGLAEAAGATRIDRPMMEIAAKSGGRICLALVLRSTADISSALLHDCLKQAGQPTDFDLLIMSEHWVFFEAGDTEAYARAIANSIRAHLITSPETKTVILAQVSMGEAAQYLAQYLNSPDLHILTSPESALKAVLA